MSIYLLTVRVDYWDDVEVKVIQDSPGLIVARFVAVDELQREILDSLDRPHQRNVSGREMRACLTMVVIHSRAWTVP